jgi:hypothetical protein
MDKILVKSLASVELNINLALTEIEARALEAITTYGTDSFLKVFYEKMGRHYLEPHEKGVRSLFTTIQQELPAHLNRVTETREILTKKLNGENPKL